MRVLGPVETTVALRLGPGCWISDLEIRRVALLMLEFGARDSLCKRDGHQLHTEGEGFELWNGVG